VSLWKCSQTSHRSIRHLFVCYIQVLFMHLGGGFYVSSRWFSCSSLCVTSRCFSSIQVVQLHLSLLYIKVLFNHPGGFSCTSLCVTSRCFSSIHVVQMRLSLPYIQVLSSVHPSGSTFIQGLFIHPSIGFCVTSRCFSSRNRVIFISSIHAFHPGTRVILFSSIHPSGSVAPLFEISFTLHPSWWWV